jgi:hypothetical protein
LIETVLDAEDVGCGQYWMRDADCGALIRIVLGVEAINPRVTVSTLRTEQKRKRNADLIVRHLEHIFL